MVSLGSAGPAWEVASIYPHRGCLRLLTRHPLALPFVLPSHLQDAADLSLVFDSVHADALHGARYTSGGSSSLPGFATFAPCVWTVLFSFVLTHSLAPFHTAAATLRLKQHAKIFCHAPCRTMTTHYRLMPLRSDLVARAWTCPRCRVVRGPLVPVLVSFAHFTLPALSPFSLALRLSIPPYPFPSPRVERRNPLLRPGVSCQSLHLTTCLASPNSVTRQDNIRCHRSWLTKGCICIRCRRHHRPASYHSLQPRPPPNSRSRSLLPSPKHGPASVAKLQQRVMRVRSQVPSGWTRVEYRMCWKGIVIAALTVMVSVLILRGLMLLF